MSNRDHVLIVTIMKNLSKGNNAILIWRAPNSRPSGRADIFVGTGIAVPDAYPLYKNENCCGLKCRSCATMGIWRKLSLL
jgi:hypothetical protein